MGLLLLFYIRKGFADYLPVLRDESPRKGLEDSLNHYSFENPNINYEKGYATFPPTWSRSRRSGSTRTSWRR